MNKAQKISRIMAVAKKIEPSYSIHWTIWKGKLVILDGYKHYDNSPTFLFYNILKGQTLEEVEELSASVTKNEIIQEFERNGVNHEAKSEIYEEIGINKREYPQL